MGKVYSTEGIAETPDIDFRDIKKWEQAEQDYVEKVKAFAKEKGQSEYAGEEVWFGVADGAARYIVLSLKPVKLIHLDVGDAYDYQYAHRLTAKDIKDEIESRKKLAEIFSKAKNA